MSDKFYLYRKSTDALRNFVVQYYCPMKYFIRNLSLTLLISCFYFTINAQNVGINSSGALPDSSSILDISDTTKGLLIPRMTTVHRTAIAGPATSLLVFDITTNSFWFYNGTAWEELAGGGGNPLIDADGDTKVDVEESPDEDIIRFDLAGTERWRMVDDRLESNHLGTYNLFIGADAGLNTAPIAAWEIGINNTFIGNSAGRSNTVGLVNVAIGAESLFSNTSGGANTVIGEGSMRSNITGQSNVAIGRRTLFSNTSGNENVAIGTLSLQNGNGSRNVAVGTLSGGSSTGSDNVFIGNQAGWLSLESNALIIENSNNAVSPLIHGNFVSNTLEIHGALSVGHPTTGVTQYTLPTADGMVNQVLTTNGAGVTTWATSTNTDNQDLSLSSNTLSLTNDATTVDLSGYLDNTDSQQADVFQLNGNNLELSLQNDGIATQTVDLSSLSDNLGNHIATQNVQLNGNWLGNDGGNEGVGINNNGQVGVGTITPSERFTVIGGSFDGTEDVAVGGTATGSSGLGDPGAAFDNNLTTPCYSVSSAVNQWVMYDFGPGNNIIVGKYQLQMFNSMVTTKPNGWVLEGSNDGTTFTPLHTLNAYSDAIQTFANTTAYQYYRFRFHNGPEIAGGFPSLTVDEISLFKAYTAPSGEVFTVSDFGQVRINQQYSLPTVDGAASQVLTTDGAGVTSWTTTSSINTDNQQADVFQLNGNSLELSLQNDGIATQTVDLSSFSNDTLPLIQDADRDTKIQVEETADEDIIRFDVAGGEKWRMIGDRIEPSNATGSIAIGTSALANSSASNIAIGNLALATNISAGSDLNIAIGDQSLRYLNGSGTDSYENTAVGGYTMAANTVTGTTNSVFGVRAGYSMTAGRGNSFIGVDAGLTTNTGSFNVALGLGALYSNQVGNRNTMLGFFAGNSNTSSNNVMIGALAGQLNTGGGNVFIGNEVASTAAQSGTVNRLFIDNSATNDPLVWGDFTSNLLRVNGTLQVNNPGATGYVFPAVRGTNGQHLQTDGSGNVSWVSSDTLSLIQDADRDTKIQVEETADEDIIRFSTGDAGNSSTEYFNMTNGRLNVLNTGGSVFVGDSAGFKNDGGTRQNTFIGAEAGNHTTIGYANVAVGYRAFKQSTTALGTPSPQHGNTVVGGFALEQNIIGVENTAIGFANLQRNTGGRNVSVGARAGQYNVAGAVNTFIGYGSGRSNTGTGNVFLGYYSGGNSGNVNSQLYIDNSSTGAPLIWGDFASNTLRVNGTMQVNDPGATGYIFPAARGTNGQILQTDAAGNLSWVNPAVDSDNQDLGLTGNSLSLTNDATTVDLSGYLDNTDAQTLTLTGNSLSISGGNSVILPGGGNPLVDADGDTKVDVEETADEDIIRFDLMGTERWVMTARRLEPANNANNLFVGVNAGLNTSGDHNTFLGSNNGANNAAGQQNTSVGSSAFVANTTGSFNSSFGVGALASNTTGADNTAIGTIAMQNNTTGEFNTAVGSSALNANVTGASNTAIGRAALAFNTADDNTAVGFFAMLSNVGGTNNTALGREALRTNVSGNNNTAVGVTALFSSTGNDNTALGTAALTLSTGSGNTGVGRSSMTSATTGSNNTALGLNSMSGVTTGGSNVSIGVNTLTNVGLGSSNVAIGFGAGSSVVGGSGNVFLGNNAGSSFSGSNELYIENSSSIAPLIHGNFTTNTVEIHGSLSIGNAGTGATQYTFPPADGTANQVLTTNGAGVTSWTSAGGADNLGNHAATQNIQLGSNWLSGDGGNEGIRIDASGNIGAGVVTVPANTLDIATAARTGTHATGAPLYITGNMGAASSGVEFRHTNGSQGIGIGYTGIYSTGSNTDQDLWLVPKGTGNVRINNVYSLPSVDGTANQVLTTNGAGVASWTPITTSLTAKTTLAYATNWLDYLAASYSAGAHFKSSDGMVLLEGLVKKSVAVTSGDVICTLPVGSRPVRQKIYTVMTSAGVARLDIATNGNVTIGIGLTALNWVSLEGISFRTD